MSNLLAIDPGEDCGFAFYLHGRLSHAWLATIPKTTIGLPVCSVRPDRLVIERPRWYARRSKVDANDLIVLALRVGLLTQAVGAVKTEIVCPSDWKGEMSKDVCERRVRGFLSEQETEIALACLRHVARGKQNNVWDAIGIGLFGLGRFER